MCKIVVMEKEIFAQFATNVMDEKKKKERKNESIKIRVVEKQFVSQ